MEECPMCGKKGVEFDAPLFGKACRKYAEFSPCVGDWVCLSKTENSRQNDVGNVQSSAQNSAVSEPQD
jgi:hypothetical protein